MASLYEKYRPKTFPEVIGQTKALKRLLALKKTCGFQGQVLWITGESGTGKTTLARIIAATVSDDVTTHEIDAQDVSMDKIREWESSAQSAPLSFNPNRPRGHFAFIVNEAHGLSNKAVSRLQTVLEDKQVQRNSTWIFTTTNKGHRSLFDDKFDACPFLSRAVCIQLDLDGAALLAMAKRVLEIAQIEGIDGKPLEAYTELIARCNGNMRQALQLVASGEMVDD